MGTGPKLVLAQGLKPVLLPLSCIMQLACGMIIPVVLGLNTLMN